MRRKWSELAEQKAHAAAEAQARIYRGEVHLLAPTVFADSFVVAASATSAIIRSSILSKGRDAHERVRI